jgi:DNA-binding NarL/FixJ family response regulator
VFLNIVRGTPVSEIAEELSLSVKTVSNYRMRILEKMHMTSNAEIIHYAHWHGLIG